MFNFISDHCPSCILHPFIRHHLSLIPPFAVYSVLLLYKNITMHFYLALLPLHPSPLCSRHYFGAICSLHRILLPNSAASLPGNLENIFCSLSSLSAGAEKFIFYQPQGSKCYSENPAFNHVLCLISAVSHLSAETVCPPLALHL